MDELCHGPLKNSQWSFFPQLKHNLFQPHNVVHNVCGWVEYLISSTIKKAMCDSILASGHRGMVSLSMRFGQRSGETVTLWTQHVIDMMTKALRLDAFQILRGKLGMCDLEEFTSTKVN
ncbi:hypothetical protein V2J09_009287 [Rumex salicifolius]